MLGIALQTLRFLGLISSSQPSGVFGLDPVMIAEQLELTSDSEANTCYFAGDNDYASLIVFEDWLLDGEDDKGNPKIAYDWLLSHIDYLRKLVEEKKNENSPVKKFLYQSWIL